MRNRNELQGSVESGRTLAMPGQEQFSRRAVRSDTQQSDVSHMNGGQFPMQVGLVGLGRMGANISRRWLQDGHTVIGYARTKATVDGLVAEGALSGGAS